MTDLWNDYATIHKEIVEAEDLDPVYPLLKEIARLLDIDKESAAWMCHVFVAYYDCGSFLNAFEQMPVPKVPYGRLLTLRCDTERRGHRSPERLQKHFESVVSIAENNGGLYTWLTKYLRDTPQQSWTAMLDPLESIWGNGRWASYKLVEMIGYVCDLPVEAPDMGHANSTGPRQGLNYLYKDLPTGNRPQDIAILDAISEDLLQKLAQRGINAKMQEAETSLCSLKSMMKGNYYIGQDLDAMLEEILHQPCGLTEMALEARSNLFPHRYLGEKNGRTGVDRERLKHYKLTGEILTR